MYKKFAFLFFFFLGSFVFGADIEVNNRILMSISGKPITVVDVMKKMDILFYRQYPHLVFSPQARLEFYQANFTAIFSALVNDHLILADAEEMEMAVSDVDVREEMEKLFGPDVVGNVDKLGLTYAEAWDLIKKDTMVKQMNQRMIRSKAMIEVSPKELKRKYVEYLNANPAESEWRYLVITIKGEDVALLEKICGEVREKILQNVPLANIKKEFNANVSKEFARKEKEISPQHKAILEKLKPLEVSLPSLKKNENGYTAQLFYLKEQKLSEPLPFNKLEEQFHRELLQKAIMHHAQNYADKLRARYGITDAYLAEMIPEDFKPFEVR